MSALIRELWIDERGLATVEYALLLVFIVMVGVPAWKMLGNVIAENVREASETLDSVGK